MQEKIPEFLYKNLLKQYGQEITDKIIEGYCEKKPVTLRVNTLKNNIDNLKEILNNKNIEFEDVPWYEDALIIKNAQEEDIRKIDIYENGEIYMQSLSSMIPPIILEPKNKENILDMTAAPGGKTTQIAAISQNKAMITACEKNKIRAERLKYNLQKQGVTCTNVMIEDARNLSEFFSFDKILLDAPCSGSGTANIFRQTFTEELIARSAKTQEELLIKAIKMLKPGQEIVYSTCSILAEENEKIIQKVISKFKLEIIPIKELKGIPLLPSSIEGTICVCPSKLYEGFFVAKLKKI